MKKKKEKILLKMRILQNSPLEKQIFKVLKEMKFKDFQVLMNLEFDLNLVIFNFMQIYAGSSSGYVGASSGYDMGTTSGDVGTTSGDTMGTLNIDMGISNVNMAESRHNGTSNNQMETSVKKELEMIHALCIKNAPFWSEFDVVKLCLFFGNDEFAELLKLKNLKLLNKLYKILNYSIIDIGVHSIHGMDKSGKMDMLDTSSVIESGKMDIDSKSVVEDSKSVIQDTKSVIESGIMDTSLGSRLARIIKEPTTLNELPPISKFKEFILDFDLEFYPLFIDLICNNNSIDWFEMAKIMISDLIFELSNNNNTARNANMNVGFKITKKEFDNLVIPRRKLEINLLILILAKVLETTSIHYNKHDPSFISSIYDFVLDKESIIPYIPILEILIRMESSLLDNFQYLNKILDPKITSSSFNFVANCFHYYCKSRNICKFITTSFTILAKNDWRNTVFMNTMYLEKMGEYCAGILDIQLFELIKTLTRLVYDAKNDDFQHKDKKLCTRESSIGEEFGECLVECLRVFKSTTKPYFETYLKELLELNLEYILMENCSKVALNLNFVSMQICPNYCSWLPFDSILKLSTINNGNDLKNKCGETLLLYLDYCTTTSIMGEKECKKLVKSIWEMKLEPNLLIAHLNLLCLYKKSQKHLDNLFSKIINNNHHVPTVFFECRVVQSRLLKVLFGIVGEMVGDTKLKEFMVALADRKIDKKDSDFIVNHHPTSPSNLLGLDSILKFVETIPVEFFSAANIEQMQVLLYILEKIVVSNAEIRNLFEKFTRFKVDRCPLFMHPLVFLHLLQTSVENNWKSTIEIMVLGLEYSLY